MGNNIDVIQGRRPLSLDGVDSQSPQPKPPAARPPERQTYHAPRSAAQKRNFWARLQMPALVLAGLVGGFFADNLSVGLTLLAGYGIFAIIARVPSRTTFTLALLLLGAISLMLLIKPSATLISNFSTYAFVLLLIGVITLGRESKLPKRMRRKYRR